MKRKQNDLKMLNIPYGRFTISVLMSLIREYTKVLLVERVRNPQCLRMLLIYRTTMTNIWKNLNCFSWKLPNFAKP